MATVVADHLLSSGVTHVYGYPGDPIIELMERFREREIDVVLARREATAAFMAEASAMSGGPVGVCLSTLGPGSTALLNGVAAANLDRVPMLALSGQIETAREQFFTHQVVDHGRLYAPVTKWASRVEPGSAATVMRKALRTATAERPGAVHLTIAGDDVAATAKDHEVRMPPGGPAAQTVSVLRSPGAEDPLKVLAGSRRPVILAGTGAVRAEASAALVRLSERLGAPVVVAPMAKGVFPETHPNFAGVLDMACNQVVWGFLGGADSLLAVGFDAVELIKPWSLRVPVLHVDSTPNTDQVYAADVEVVGDVRGALDWLADGFDGEPRWDESEVAEHRRALRDAYYAGRETGVLNPTDVVDEVQAAVPEDTIVSCDVGSHKLLVGQGWQATRPRSVLMTNGLSAMGFGLPALIAAKLAHPDRPVVGLIGDGGFAMTATELRLASSLGLGIVVVVFVDNSLNRIELKQQAKSYPSTATRLEDIDLVAMAGAMGCDGVRVSSAAELSKALDGVESSTRPLVVEARVDPSQYTSQF